MPEGMVTGAIDRPSRPVRRGFTLLELLVVIGVIAVLISMLLPALSRARDLARRTVCLSNVRQISAAAEMYANEQPDGMWPVFPAAIRGCNLTFDSWRFGGKTTHPFWRTYVGGVGHHTAAERPLNRYLYPDIDLRDPPNGRVELFVYRCPSDFGSYQRENWARRNIFINPNISAYDDVGTSYQMNTKWWHVVLAEAAAAPASRATRCKAEIWTRTKPMFRKASFVSPARFVWLYDQTIDVISNLGVSRPGDHGGINWSTAAFLDGHVEYLEATPGAYETPKYILKFGRMFAPAR